MAKDLGLSPATDLEDEQLAIILDRTNFYSEMGGQVGDRGMVASATMTFDVETTRAVGGYVLHIGRIRKGKLHVTDTVTATVTDARQGRKKPHLHAPSKLGAPRNPRRRHSTERLARRSGKTPLRFLT